MRFSGYVRAFDNSRYPIVSSQHDASQFIVDDNGYTGSCSRALKDFLR